MGLFLRLPYLETLKGLITWELQITRSNKLVFLSKLARIMKSQLILCFSLSPNEQKTCMAHTYFYMGRYLTIFFPTKSKWSEPQFLTLEQSDEGNNYVPLFGR